MLITAEKTSPLNSKKEFIKYLKSLGIEVKSHTKARGHQGIYFQNRIDISKNIDDKRAVEVLAHEFAHFIHSKIEPDMPKTGGSLEKLFCIENCEEVRKELVTVTNFVDKNSLFESLKIHRSSVSSQLKHQEDIIKSEYPNFMRSKKFKDFDKAIKKSKAKYLLKYDRIKLVSPFLRYEQILTIDNIERDFPELKPAFTAYIRLKSLQKKQTRISQRKNRLQKYYEKPSELFARFVEGLVIDWLVVKALAPVTFKTFQNLAENGYYGKLGGLFFER